MSLPAVSYRPNTLTLFDPTTQWQHYDRVVMLGASNLSRSVATAVAQAKRWAVQPSEIMLAFGHGRSYGTRSSVFGRSLPGLSTCGLWKDLDRRPTSSIAAVITDVGNDLFYDATVDQLARWVRTCIDRLEQQGAKIVSTRLPTFNADRIPDWQFRIMRRILYPKCTLTLPEVRARGEAINLFLAEEADRGRIALVSTCPTWFGLDPVHFLSCRANTVWNTFLARWQDTAPAAMPLPAGPISSWRRPREAFYLHTRVPHRRWWFGVEQHRPQPIGRLPCGTRISLY